MPKRKREISPNIDSIRKKLKKLEKQVREHESRRHRPRKRIIVTSSSSEHSSREASPESWNSQIHGRSPLNAQSGTVDEDLQEILEQECRDRSALPKTPPPINTKEPSIAAVSLELDHPQDPKDTQGSSTDLVDPFEIMDSATLEILGEDPSATIEYGAPVHKEIASRFEHLAVNGLDKETRKLLSESYLTPSNCTQTGAPILNDEIRAALPETVIKRDKIIQAKQKQLATVISCVASTITDQLTNKDKNHELLKKLMDIGRLLCDIQHTESIARRNFSLFSVKKEMKEHLMNTKLDTYLFGHNLPEVLKTAKAVNKSGFDLKIPNKQPKKTQNQIKKAQPTKNWKRPAAPGRQQPGPHRSRENNYQREQPSTSSKRSPPRSRTTRRR